MCTIFISSTVLFPLVWLQSHFLDWDHDAPWFICSGVLGGRLEPTSEPLAPGAGWTTEPGPSPKMVPTLGFFFTPS